MSLKTVYETFSGTSTGSGSQVPSVSGLGSHLSSSLLQDITSQIPQLLHDIGDVLNNLDATAAK